MQKDGCFEQLQELCAILPDENKMALGNIDNPGWQLSIDLRNTVWRELSCAYELSETTDEDWFAIKIDHGDLNAFGGAGNLQDIISNVIELLYPDHSQTEYQNARRDAVLWMQSFYSGCCNGDWEHTYGVSITKEAQRKWRVAIALQDTALECIPFDPVRIKPSSGHWVKCFKEESTKEFIGYGGAFNLVDILSVFMKWTSPEIKSFSLLPRKMP